MIHLAAAMGKTQRHRDLPVALRAVAPPDGRSTATRSASRRPSARGSRPTLRDLFPDYDRPLAFTFSKTGRVLLRERLLCPHRLGSLGQTRLLATCAAPVPARTATGERLLSAAEASVRSAPPPAVAAVLSARLSALVAELEMHECQAEALKEQIEALGATLKADGALPPIDEAVSGITLFNLARIVGQTGPLADFASKAPALALRRDESPGA